MGTDMMGKINVAVNRVNTNSNSDKINKSKAPEATNSTINEGAKHKSELGKESEQQNTALTQENIKEAVNRVSDFVQNIQRDLLFNVDDESGELIVRVVDSETKEVVRQIPSEELLKIAESLEKTGGSLLSTKA